MKLQALHSQGRLDISSQESLQGEEGVFRLTLKPGQIVDVDDKWRYLKNIDTAVNQGLLRVIEYTHPVSTTEAVIDTIVLTALHISNKSVDMSRVPYSVQSVEVFVLNSAPLTYGIDYFVSLFPPTVSWNGSSLADVLSVGDTMVIQYNS